MNETTRTIRIGAHRRTTPEQRLRYVREYLQSGLSKQAFIGQNGFSLASLTKWLKAARATGEVPALRKRPHSKAGRQTLRELPIANVLGTSAWAAELRGRSGSVLCVGSDLPPRLLSLLLRRL